MSWLVRGLIGSLLAGAAVAQTTPLVSSNQGQHTLRLPYLDYGAGYTAMLTSSDLLTWVVQTVATASGSSDATTPALAVAGSNYTLLLPNLQIGSGSNVRNFAATLTSTDLKTFHLDVASLVQISAGGPGAVQVANLYPQTRGSTTFYSSTRLLVSWGAPPGVAPEFYRVTASEYLQGTREVLQVTGTSATLGGLKSATKYHVMVTACYDSGCGSALAAIPVNGTTAAEYWQLQGSGNSVATLNKTVADGNVLISATRIGPDAASSNANRIQLYYKAAGGAPSLAVATTASNTDATDVTSYLSFTSLAGSTGLLSPPTATSLVAEVGGGHAIPLKSGRVRLFFDPLGSDQRSRLLSLDSADGYLGRDFNRGSATLCATTADYAVGGGCEPTVAIGIEGDTQHPSSKIKFVRQFKVGWPSLDDWRWDEASGTFLVFTTDSIPGCTPYLMNHAYAIWNGSEWQVQYDSNGCPKMFKSAQAAYPLHLGGKHYKLIYSDPSQNSGKIAGSNLPYLGPKKIIYGYAQASGNNAHVEFDDWEAQSQARDVHFLWPNGEALSESAEGYIDDYAFIMPTGSADLQVMYLAITNGVDVPFAAAAVLQNP